MSNTKHSEWLSLKDVQQLMGIGRTKTYELVTAYCSGSEPVRTLRHDRLLSGLKQ
jgi:hypothetical protein